MFKTSKNITDLKRKQSIINLGQINIYACAVIGMILIFLIISILCVAAYPNSNFPANI